MRLKVYQLLLKIGVIASLLSFFIISNAFYFPYITGKQLYLNVLVEIMVVFWVAMLVRYPEERPKNSWISWSLLIFLGALLLSSIFGVDFNLSFWGDTERMLGWFSLIHFVALYFITITVFKTKKDWLMLFDASLAAAVALALYAFAKYDGGKNMGGVNMTSNISTLGNATYVAGVMLFAWWFAVYGLIKTKDWTARFFYGLAMAITLGAFFFADVSGSQAGFGLSVVVFFGLWGVLHKNVVIRKRAWLALGSLLTIGAIMFSFRSAPIFDHNRVGKVLRDFSLQNTTLNTRFYAWNAAWKGFLEKPLLGSGYGNFALWFDKYFDGSYYQWTMSEEYFDRAHNNLLDILSTGGIISLLAYLSIFVFVGFYLIRAYRSGRVPLLELAMVVAVFSAYFVHNLAVFDAIANYILLMFALGFVYWLTAVPEAEEELADVKLKHADRRAEKKIVDIDDRREIGVWLIGGLIAMYLVFGINNGFAKMLSSSIEAAGSWQSGSISTVTEEWKKAMSYKTSLDRDLRGLLATQIFGNYSLMTKQPEASKELFALAISGLEANLKLGPKDSMTNLWMSQVYYYKGLLYQDITDWEKALEYVDIAITNGGEHIQPLLFKSGVLSTLGKQDESERILRTALSWYDGYWVAYCHLADIYLSQKKYDTQALEDLGKCLDYSEKAGYLNADELKPAMEAYDKNKEWRRAKKAGEIIYKDQPSDILKARIDKWMILAE